MADLDLSGTPQNGVTPSEGASPALSNIEGALVATNGNSSMEPNTKTRNRPRTYPYFSYLPYDVEPDSRRRETFDEILRYLFIAVEAGDFSPGAIHWTRELRQWLGLKFDPPVETRVKLVKLYYELALAPGIDSGVSERFASMFMYMVK
jgi:proteasome activator subunit 4